MERIIDSDGVTVRLSLKEVKKLVQRFYDEKGKPLPKEFEIEVMLDDAYSVNSGTSYRDLPKEVA